MSLRSVVCLTLGLCLTATACGATDVADAKSTTTPAVSTAPARTTLAGTNLALHSVSLDEVIFDTFDGGSIRLSEAPESEVIALRDAIPPIDRPTYETNPLWLQPGELILGMVDADGQAWAWPHRILNLHEIVNDTIADVPVLVSYCPLCRSGVIYDRRVLAGDEQRTLSFGNTSALYENDLVMIDRETNTYWWQVRGIGIVGDLTNVELTVLPSGTTTWERWTAEHPDTLVLTRESGGRRYEGDPFASYAGFVDSGSFPFPVSDEVAGDTRLPLSTLVITVTIDGTTFAVPTTGVARTVDVAGVRVNIDGVGGGDAALDASPYPSRSTFWFAAVASFPDIVLIDD
jgi:hypothetical protein